jgi:hypothetical protein
VIACVQFGLFIVGEGEKRYAVYVGGPPNPQMGPRVRLRVEVIARDRQIAVTFLRALKSAMAERNVYRGKIISIAPEQFGVLSLVKFHTLPVIAREDIVLPDGALERIERHAVTFSEHADILVKAGRSLHRGVLMYGSPGTGKTLTIMYLASRMTGRTIILMSGLAMGRISQLGQFVRDLAPATIVVEDVDLIAQERGLPGQQAHPLLFELMNQMDGLADDIDVLFILELYARGLGLDGVRLADYVEPTEGASPAYIKELLRRAALIATIETGAAKLRDAHLRQAMEELSAGGELAKRIVGFGSSVFLPVAPSVGPMRPSGFPGAVSPREDPRPGR